MLTGMGWVLVRLETWDSRIGTRGTVFEAGLPRVGESEATGLYSRCKTIVVVYWSV